MIIQPAKNICGTINLPGDKSISHRAAMFSALANGETLIENFSSSADCTSTLACLEKLGVEINRQGSAVHIKGVGKTGFRPPSAPLNCGNSGTTVRLISGILAGQKFTSVLTGDESLSKRPMKRIIEPLQQMGAKIESNENCLPLTIHGQNPLRTITYQLPMASAQVKSCVLLAGLNADGETKVKDQKTKTAVSTIRDHTELMLRWLGVEVREEFIETDGEFVLETSVKGDSVLTARDIFVPSDISSAAFFLVAAACLPGSDLTLQNVGLNPTRTAIVEVLRGFGAQIEIFNQRTVNNEPIGDLQVVGRENLSGGAANILRGEMIAGLIDELPVLAVFGTQLENGLEIRDAAELRVKESDRINTVVENLRRIGAGVEEFPDGLKVYKSALYGAEVESYGDHRIAMAFAIAGLLAKSKINISGAEAVAVSFPEFFSTLNSIKKQDRIIHR
jgi:3-phosphoshikimate 1-carboxyvinyltransferase